MSSIYLVISWVYHLVPSYQPVRRNHYTVHLVSFHLLLIPNPGQLLLLWLKE